MTVRCSEAAAERGDSRLGTAPPQHEWLLVEHAAPWPVTAPFGGDLPTALLQELGHPEVRTLFVRRHGSAGAPHRMRGPRRWFSLRGGKLRTGEWTNPDDLRVCVDPLAGEPYVGPLVLVCTHGVHDVCCAVTGRPVAAALAARWPEATFECSHVGGDRFAPNILVFPDLACFAGMSPDLAGPVVEAHLAGRTDPQWLRGVAGLHPAEQVAVGAVLERAGPGSSADLRTQVLSQEGTLGAGRWTIEVQGRTHRFRVVVDSGREPTASRLTCRAVREARALTWDAVEVQPVD
jgi:hypothetical protein